MPQTVIQVDAFTSQPFAGNPAAVCILVKPRDEEWMRRVAREMNLSETAFVVRHGDEWLLRWFTPMVEVDLCGHATLATAHVLFEDGHATRDEAVHFQTRSGRLTARSTGGWIEMDFPSAPPRPMSAPAGLLEAIGVTDGDAAFVGTNDSDWLIAIQGADRLRALAPDMNRLAGVEARGVIVTAPSDDEKWDFVSRFFAPAVGVPEDPVTGSAHCCLAPYWAERLDRNELVGWQASARGGEVRVRQEGARVMLTGQAVTVMRGALLG
ncbi:MAG TPA: PhzF family phenazine biosynthesis protein [Longimicrobiales bacterium]|nr:PhzF family phenazine biosynthesis protein [Longimicrobiales bacterium]